MLDGQPHPRNVEIVLFRTPLCVFSVFNLLSHSSPAFGCRGVFSEKHGCLEMVWSVFFTHNASTMLLSRQSYVNAISGLFSSRFLVASQNDNKTDPDFSTSYRSSPCSSLLLVLESTTGVPSPSLGRVPKGT